MNRSRRLLPTVTKKRLEWLEQLEGCGAASRHNVVGYHTMQLDWTQWAYTDGNETISEAEFDRRFPSGDPTTLNDPRWEARGRAWETWSLCGEMLTDAGRQILADHRMSCPHPEGAEE